METCINCDATTSSQTIGDTGTKIGPVCGDCQTWSPVTIVTSVPA